MEFINSFMLWTALAAGIPIVLHLLNRQKPKTVVIPTVQFIVSAAKKSSGTVKINNLLLLLIRMLILIALSLFLARPFMSVQGKKEVQSEKNYIVVLDNSFYTSQTVEALTQLEHIKKAALKLIDSLPSNKKYALYAADINTKLTPNKDELRSFIENLERSKSRLDVNDKLTKISNKFKDESHEIYLINDLNKGSWNFDYELSKNIIHIPVPKRVGNVMVESVKVVGTDNQTINAPAAFEPVQFKIQISGDRNLSGLKTTLEINNKLVDDKIIIDSNSNLNFSLPHIFEEAGVYSCKISINSDDNRLEDNSYFLSLQVSPPQNITILSDDKEFPSYIKAAIAPTGWQGKNRFNVKVTSYKNLASAKQSSDIIILTDSISLEQKGWQELELFVKAGGQVLIIPNEKTDTDLLNDKLQTWMQSVVNAHKSVNSLSQPSPDIFSQSTLKFSTDLAIEEHYSIQTTNEHYSLWQYADGLTGLAKIPDGKGNIIFIGLFGSIKNSSFIHSPAFILFWQDLLKHLHDTTSDSTMSTFIQPTEIVLPSTQSLNTWTITTPLGLVDKVPQAPNSQATVYESANIPGIYKTNIPQLPEFAVNSQRHKNFSQYPKTPVHFKQKEVDKTNSQQKLNFLSPDNFLRSLIILTIILIFLEISIANRRSHANA